MPRKNIIRKVVSVFILVGVGQGVCRSWRLIQQTISTQFAPWFLFDFNFDSSTFSRLLPFKIRKYDLELHTSSISLVY